MNERNQSFFKNQCMGCVRRCPESPVIRTADGAEYQGAERRKEVQVCRDWPISEQGKHGDLSMSFVIVHKS